MAKTHIEKIEFYGSNKEQHDAQQELVKSLRAQAKQDPSLKTALKEAQRDMKRANDRARYYGKQVKKEGAQHWDRTDTKVSISYRQPSNANKTIPTSEREQMITEIKTWHQELKDKVTEAAILRPDNSNIRANKLLKRTDVESLDSLSDREVQRIWSAYRETHLEETGNAFSAEKMEEKENHEIEAFHDSGYDWVNAENLKLVKMFFAMLDDKGIDIGSDLVMRFIGEQIKDGVTDVEEMFEKFVEEYYGGELE